MLKKVTLFLKGVHYTEGETYVTLCGIRIESILHYYFFDQEVECFECLVKGVGSEAYVGGSD